MAFIKCQYTNDYLLTADSDSQKTKENGNAYQPEEKTVKNRCCMVCCLPCSSGLCCGYSVEFSERQAGIYELNAVTNDKYLSVFFLISSSLTP